MNEILKLNLDLIKAIANMIHFQYVVGLILVMNVHKIVSGFLKGRL